MTAKTNRIISLCLMAIPTLVLIIGGTMKIIDAEPTSVVQFLTKAGFGDYLKVLGMTELMIAALILYPKTNRIGFLLASCFLAAAFCLEIAGRQPTVSVVFLVILWISMFLKNKEIFLATEKTEKPG
jgi:hypothetical protein